MKRKINNKKQIKHLGVPLRVGLSAASPRYTAGYPLLSLTHQFPSIGGVSEGRGGHTFHHQKHSKHL